MDGPDGLYETITLFCFHEATGAWYPTVFARVHLDEVRADTATANAGVANADTVTAILSVAADRSSTDESGTVRRYVGPKVYAAMEDPDGYYTFAPERDFFAVGDYASGADLPIRDADYDGGFYHAMNAGRDSVYAVTSAVFYHLLPHFEIGGR